MNPVERVLADLPILCLEADTIQQRKGKKKKSPELRVFAHENVGDCVRIASPRKPHKIVDYIQYPVYKSIDGTPLLIKFSSSQLALIQLHGLQGKELEAAAAQYLDVNFSNETLQTLDYTSNVKITSAFKDMINFIFESLSECFKLEVLKHVVHYYYTILGLARILDPRLKICRVNHESNVPTPNVQCSCALIKLMEIFRIQSSLIDVSEEALFISHYEMAYSFYILLGTAVFYTKERRVCDISPKSFDVGTACKHVAKILEYSTTLSMGMFTFKLTSQKYQDERSSKIIVALTLTNGYNDDTAQDNVIRAIIRSITINMFGRLWLCGISGFALKHDVKGNEYFGLSMAHDGAPHLNPNRSIFLNMVAPNDLPFIVETRIWGDKLNNDLFNHELTVSLRRALIPGLIYMLTGRRCEATELLTTGDLRTKVVFPADIEIDVEAIESKIRHICDLDDAMEYRQLIISALKQALLGRNNKIHEYVDTSHTQVKIQVLLRIRNGSSDSGVPISRVIVFPWINIVDIDIRIAEALSVGKVVGACDINPTTVCPSLH